MALRAASPLSAFWHEPAGQEGDKTAFQIRGLTGLELAEVNADAKPDMQNKSVRFGAAAMRSALAFALLDWRNFQDAEGAAIEFDKANRAANVERLPFEVIGELFAEILKASRVGGEQAKN